MPLSYREMSQPAAEPIQLQVAKDHLRLEIDDDDDLVTMYITAARQQVEKMIQRNIYSRNMRLTLDAFPPLSQYASYLSPENDPVEWYMRALAIILPRPALVSVTSISYRDSNGDMVTLPASAYIADTMSEPARILPAPGTTWPTLNAIVPSQVIVDFVSGTYGDGVNTDLCPKTIKMAILLLVGHYYTNREAVVADAMTNLPLAVESLLAGETFEYCYG